MLPEAVLLGASEAVFRNRWRVIGAIPWYAEPVPVHNIHLGAAESEETCPISVQRVWIHGGKRPVQR